MQAGARKTVGREAIAKSADQEAPFQLRGNAFTMMVLKLLDPDHPNLFPLLLNKIRQAPKFFRNAPVVLDLEEAPADRPIDLAGLVSRLRAHHLMPVGILGGSPQLQERALAAGLPVMPAGRPSPQPMEAATPQGVPPASRRGAEGGGGKTLMVVEPVRSGRQIYAAGGDLIVLGPVSAGAELLADGNIHVYGTLRGRALAGISGDATARIFCSSLEAELVSIAGLYRVSEDIDPSVYKKQVQIYLDSGYLCMDPIS